MHPSLAARRVLPKFFRITARVISLLVASLLLVRPLTAQTDPHPALPPHPKPAGSTAASGSGAQSSSEAPAATAPNQSGMNMPMDHSGHASMDMPMTDKMSMSFGPIADTQEASGTAWQPEATPMHAQHFMLGDWEVMAHYNAFLGYDDQSGSRGGNQLNSINWLMLMATQRRGANDLSLRGMFSLEPWTTTPKGYPLLFQSGEAYQGRPLVDRQHPHDFFMELAARYRRLINNDTALSLYVAPSGEPALGPPAFPHRLSAMDNPAAPISHHWLDSTHISFGVLTAGIAQKTWQLEGSWFNGREPDEHRWDIEPPHLDSYAGRFTWNPTPEWSAQVSHGYLKSPEALHPEEHVRRTTASVMYVTKVADGLLATTVGWGVNENHEALNALLIEPSFAFGRHTVFARAEYVEKNGEELNLLPNDRKIGLKQFTLGASHDLVEHRPYQLALGASATYTLSPRDIDAVYGRHPIGFWIFLRLRPAAMEH